MNIKNVCLIIFAAAIFCSGCSMESSGNKNSSVQTEDSTTDSSSSGTVTYSSRSNASGENTEDALLVSETFNTFIYLNLTELSFSTDNENYSTITSSKTTVTDGIKIKNEDNYITLDAEGCSAPVSVNVTGNMTGTLKIKTNESYPVNVILNETYITSTNYPCLTVTGGAVTYLTVQGGNVLTDGRVYGYGYGEEYASDGISPSVNYVADGEDTKGSLYTKGDLRISGEGSLTVNEGYKHGIYSKGAMYVFGSVITVNSTGRNCMQSVNGFTMDGGTLNLTGTGSNTNNQSRGIVVEGVESDEASGVGAVTINGGALNITTVSKAITAKWDKDDDAETLSTDDDPDASVYITGGTFVINTTGTPADESSSTKTFIDADGVYVTETTKLSPEGIEGKNSVYISGGTLYLNTTDDAINAGEYIEISDGYVYAYSSKNDAIDSNGNLTISGGYIVAIGVSTAECAFDCDNNTFAVKGGTFFGLGTNNFSTPTSSACTQNVFVASSSYTGTSGTFAVKNSSSAPVFAFEFPSVTASGTLYAVFSSPKITSGDTYTLYTGVTASGGSSFEGLYYEMPEVSGGSGKVSKSVTSSTKVYSLSASNDMTNNGPNHR